MTSSQFLGKISSKDNRIDKFCLITHYFVLGLDRGMHLFEYCKWLGQFLTYG